VTICHKGHAITVDVHAARAHIEGHGDTYAPAGAKERAACRTATEHNEPERTVETNERTPVDVLPAKEAENPAVPAPAAVRTPHPVRAELAGTARPAPHRKAIEGAHVTQAKLHTTLPFTGRSLSWVVLAALVLIAAGTFLRVSQRSRA
jgi:hypothetical protein